jgi:chaperone modulatory protein CbpM
MPKKIWRGTLLDEQVYVSVTEICHACSSRTEWIVELVEEGILEPVGKDPDDWHFPSNSISRAHTAMRLQRDLGINLAGVALALDLLSEVAMLRSRLVDSTTEF